MFLSGLLGFNHDNSKCMYNRQTCDKKYDYFFYIKIKAHGTFILYSTIKLKLNVYCLFA